MVLAKHHHRLHDVASVLHQGTPKIKNLNERLLSILLGNVTNRKMSTGFIWANKALSGFFRKEPTIWKHRANEVMSNARIKDKGLRAIYVLIVCHVKNG